MKRAKRILVFVAIFIVAVFLVIWGAALAKCEILTHKYYDEFEYAYGNNTMITDVLYFKVLNCDEKNADIYYVSETNGNVLKFEYQNGNWVETGWETIWSKSGSASGVVWPYWWQIFSTGL